MSHAFKSVIDPRRSVVDTLNPADLLKKKNTIHFGNNNDRKFNSISVNARGRSALKADPKFSTLKKKVPEKQDPNEASRAAKLVEKIKASKLRGK